MKTSIGLKTKPAVLAVAIAAAIGMASMAVVPETWAAPPKSGPKTPKVTAPGKLGLVTVNPYRIAPLTAIVRDGGHRITNATVTVLGKGEKGVPITYKVKQSSIYTYAGIPVFGLYPDHLNKVQLEYTLDDKEVVKETYEIYAGPVYSKAAGYTQKSTLPKVVPVKVLPEFKDRLYLFNHIAMMTDNSLFKWKMQGGAAEWDWTSYNWIADTNGDIRWFMDSSLLNDPAVKDKMGAMMGFHLTKSGDLIWVMSQSYKKYDLLGRQVWDRPLPDKFADASHEIIETGKGTYMIRVAASDYLRDDGKHVRTVRDHIIEVDESGRVVEYWDLNRILDPYRDNLLLALDQGAVCLNVDAAKQGTTTSKAALEDPNAPFGDVTGVGPGRNWAHVNSISYDAKDDSIVLSVRHQGTVKIGRDKQVKWILSSPEGWTGDFAKKVLKPVDKNGKPIKCENNACEGSFDWPWTQHTSYLTEVGTLVSFDNGDGRGMEQPAMPEMKYSRAVEYKIDEKSMTVQQIWEYGKERGYDWYSAITSITEYQKDKNSMMTYSATAGLMKAPYLRSILNELRYGTQDVGVELVVEGHQVGGSGYRATVIRPGDAF